MFELAFELQTRHLSKSVAALKSPSGGQKNCHRKRGHRTTGAYVTKFPPLHFTGKGSCFEISRQPDVQSIQFNMSGLEKIKFYHSDTPRKNRVKGAFAFTGFQRQHYGQPYYLNDIFRSCGVTKRTGYRILERSNWRFQNVEGNEETRGRTSLLTQEDLDRIGQMIWDNGFEARELQYSRILAAAGIDKEASDRTLRRALQTRDWRKCIACPRAWVSPAVAEQRVEFTRKSLEMRPAKKDYRDIRWSGEWHISVGSSRQARILRKLGEKYCPDCLQERLNSMPTSGRLSAITSRATCMSTASQLIITARCRPTVIASGFLTGESGSGWTRARSLSWRKIAILHIQPKRWSPGRRGIASSSIITLLGLQTYRLLKTPGGFPRTQSA